MATQSMEDKYLKSIYQHLFLNQGSIKAQLRLDQDSIKARLEMGSLEGSVKARYVMSRSGFPSLVVLSSSRLLRLC